MLMMMVMIMIMMMVITMVMMMVILMMLFTIASTIVRMRTRISTRRVQTIRGVRFPLEQFYHDFDDNYDNVELSLDHRAGNMSIQLVPRINCIVQK